jgi:predicted PurR-regulated permease PerM
MPAKQYPFYIKSTVTLFGLILLVFTLSVLGNILVPFAFAAMFAILLNPLCTRLQEIGVPKLLSVIIALFTAIIILLSVMLLLSTQITQFGETIPILKIKVGNIADNIEYWIYDHFGVEIDKQMKYLRDLADSSQALIGRTLGTVVGTLSIVLVIPVYIFMMLSYKTLIVNFLYEVFSEEHSARVAEILKETKAAIQSYIVGLLIEMVIVAAMNSTALMLLGVKYGLLLGIIGAILNMLPLIGGIISILLPILMATVTKDGYSTQIGIVIAYMVIQFIDNNVVFPRFVSVKVRLNALVSIIAVLLGNALWGISGMFLIIPFIAVLKIIFDRVDDLKPWGKLLGSEVPVQHMGQIWGRRSRRRAEPKNAEAL